PKGFDGSFAPHPKQLLLILARTVAGSKNQNWLGLLIGCGVYTMAKLIYFTPSSLDGFIANDGNLDWSTPSEEAFAFITDLHRPIGTYLYGRKEAETMAVWETPEVIPGFTPGMLDFARIWQAADKIVYSKSLETVSTPKIRLEREFDAQAV